MIRFRPFAVNFTLIGAFASTLFTMLMVYMMLAQINAQARALDELRRSDVAAVRKIGEDNRRLLRAVADKVGAVEVRP